MEENNQQTPPANDLVASTSAGVAAVAPASAAAIWPPPPGYYFLPTNEELIKDYLVKKINNEPIPVSEISSVDIYKHNPQTLAETYPQLGENVWYFFTPRSRKYPNGTWPSRSTEGGHWKATGKDIEIRFHKKVIGFKKALVYHQEGNKTDWIMHEYKLNQPPRAKKDPKDMTLDDWVLCRIYKKADTSNQNQDQDNVGNNQDNLAVAIVGSNPVLHNNNNNNNDSLVIHDDVAVEDYNPMVENNATQMIQEGYNWGIQSDHGNTFQQDSTTTFNDISLAKIAEELVNDLVAISPDYNQTLPRKRTHY